MAQIPFEHKGCNGWAIYESQYIDSDNARNMHVVEGTITSEGGKVYFTPNAMLKTVCNRQKLKGGKILSALQTLQKFVQSLLSFKTKEMRFAVLAFRTSMQTLNNDACQLFGSWDSVLYENRAQNLKSKR